MPATSAFVPFAVRMPSVSASSVAEMCVLTMCKKPPSVSTKKLISPPTDVQARSLVPLLSDDGPDRLAVTETIDGGLSVRTRRWKYIGRSWRQAASEEQLYDLAQDPHERTNVADRHPELEHVLVVPDREDRLVREGRHLTVHVSAPVVPGCSPYRLILRLDKLWEVLDYARPDVIELGSSYLPPWAALHHRDREDRHRQRTPVVAGFFHTDYPRAYVETSMRRLGGRRLGRWGRRLSTRYLRAMHRRFDVTLVASRPFPRRLARLGLGRTEYVPLGVDTRTFHPRQRSDALRRELGVGPDDLLLVYAGRLDQEKRLPVLIDAVNRLPPDLRHHLLLIGRGPLHDELRERAATDPRLTVRPHEADRVALARHLASADLYVTAAPHETFGLAVIEAQSCGLPVAGVRAGALVDRVPAGVGHLAAPDDPVALAAVIESLARSDRAGPGRAAREMVERRFSWTTTFDRLLGVYDELLTGSAEPHHV